MINKESREKLFILASFILLFFILLIAIKSPNCLFASRKDANMATARNILIQLYDIEMIYQKTRGGGNFTNNLFILSDRKGDNSYLTREMEFMQRTPHYGYLLGVIKVTPKKDNREAHFSIVAFPAVKEGLARTGNDCYYIDERGILRHSGSPSIIPDNNSSPVK